MTILSFFSYNLPSTTHTQVCKSQRLQAAGWEQLLLWRQGSLYVLATARCLEATPSPAWEHGNWAKYQNAGVSPVMLQRSHGAQGLSAERGLRIPLSEGSEWPCLPWPLPCAWG